MTHKQALRIRHQHNIPVEVNHFNPAGGYTLEAWVKFAPTDRAIRLYEKKNYDGHVLRLKAGAYEDLRLRHFTDLGSVCLPEGLEIVLFSEPNFRGEALAVRHDLHAIDDKWLHAASVVVIDRYHRRQSVVVLFDKPNYQGKAELVFVGKEWRPAEPTATDSYRLVDVGSAWVPPGVQLGIWEVEKSPVEILHTGRLGAEKLLHIRYGKTFRAAPFIRWSDQLIEPKVEEQYGKAESIVVPEGESLIVFANPHYQGDFKVLRGKHTLTDIGWKPRSGFWFPSEGTDGFEGVILLTEREIIIVPSGKTTPEQEGVVHVFVPPGYQAEPMEASQQPLRPGFNPGVKNTYRVSKWVRRELQGDVTKLPLMVKRITCPRVPDRKDGSFEYVIHQASISADSTENQVLPPKEPIAVPELTTLELGLVEAGAYESEVTVGSQVSIANDAGVKIPSLFVGTRDSFSEEGHLEIPSGQGMVVFNQPDFQGNFAIFRGKKTIVEIGLFPRSALRFKTNKSKGIGGVLIVTDPKTIVVPPGHETPPIAGETGVWVPPGYQIEPTDSAQQELLVGYHINVTLDKPYKVSLDPRGDGTTSAEDGASPFFESSLQGWQKKASTFARKDDLPAFLGVDVPKDYALFLFEAKDFGGRHEVIVGRRDDLSDLEWEAQSGIYAYAPQGINGVIGYHPHSYQTVKVYNANTPLDDTSMKADGAVVIIPPGYHLLPETVTEATPIYGPGFHENVNLKGYVVERYAGILTNHEQGLKVERKPQPFDGAAEELRFAGQLIRPERWQHLALTHSESGDLRYFLNGRQVGVTQHAHLSFDGQWLLGEQLRGSIARARVWDRALDEKVLKKLRFWDAIPEDSDQNTLKQLLFQKSDLQTVNAEELPRQLFVGTAAGHAAPPNAVAVALDADFPLPPEKTGLGTRVLQQVKAHNQRLLHEEQQKGQQLIQQAQERAKYQIALAHEQARREVHLRGINRMFFHRKGMLYGVDKHSEEGKKGLRFFEMVSVMLKPNPYMLHGWDDIHRIVHDIVIYPANEDFVVFSSSRTNGDNKGDKYGELVLRLYRPDESVEDGKQPEEEPYIYTFNRTFQSQPWVALAARSVSSDNFFPTEHANLIRYLIYGISEEGQLFSQWLIFDNEGNYSFSECRKVENPGVPLDRLSGWDLAIGDMKIEEDEDGLKKLTTTLYWTNGREIYEGGDKTLWEKGEGAKIRLAQGAFNKFYYGITIPHSVSPHPMAITLSPQGDLIWIDAQYEKIRMLKRYVDYSRVEDLYPAINPGAGLAICDLPSTDASTREDSVAFIYWTASEQKTFEAAVLDTPGCYLDLYDDHTAGKPGTKVTDAVQLEQMVDVKWEPQPSVMTLADTIGTIYGPFSAVEGFSVEFNIRFGHGMDEFLAIGNEVLLRGDYVSVEFVNSAKETVYQIQSSDTTGRQEDEWVSVRMEVKAGDVQETLSDVITLYINNKKVTYPVEFSLSRVDFPGDYWQKPLPIRFLPSIRMFGENQAQGFYSPSLVDQVRITSLEDKKKELALHNASSIRGLVKGAPTLAYPKILQNQEIPANIQTQKTEVLHLATPDSHLALSPIRLDFQQGWTISVEGVWEKPDNLDQDVCLYELASFENENRLVCVIEKNGFPNLYLRWNNEEIYEDNSSFYERFVQPKEIFHLTWTFEPKTKFVTTYLNGDCISSHELMWKPQVAVFEGHRLGAPNPAQSHRLVDGALWSDFRKKHKPFTGFTGQIYRFSAWNTLVPEAARGWQNLPPADPTWDRSLVTFTSYERYLHAGRLDGKEPPVALFPIDMDGGFVMESKLDHTHAAYTAAQHALSAARQYAISQKQAAREKALRDQAAAQAAYDAAHLTAEQQLASAKADADTTRQQARQTRQAADQKAMEEQARHRQEREKKRAEGKQKADRIKEAAVAKKNRQVDAAQAKLDIKTQERDRKEREYHDKSK